MLQNSTFLYYYTLSENEEECGIYDLNHLDQSDMDDFAEVYQYLDSLCVEAPESALKSLFEKL